MTTSRRAWLAQLIGMVAAPAAAKALPVQAHPLPPVVVMGGCKATRSLAASLARLEPNQTPLVALLQKLQEKQGPPARFEWVEDDYAPRLIGQRPRPHASA